MDQSERQSFVCDGIEADPTISKNVLIRCRAPADEDLPILPLVDAEFFVYTPAKTNKDEDITKETLTHPLVDSPIEGDS
eukprot:scaffold4117_cov97-Cylindrotheca_fusiformis.AAC.6